MEWQSGQATARVDLEGGRLASLCIDGLEILVTEGSKPSRFGSFPMVPWCGRLAHGKLAHAGREHAFPLTSPPHANHGRGYLQAWEPLDERTIRTALSSPWPFGGECRQRFDLGPDSLTVTLSVHAADEPMPAMLGWHPWFLRQLARGGPAALTFAAGKTYATDEHQVPTGELLPPPPGPWDHCFTDLQAGPSIHWPGALTLDISSDLDHWVIFTEPAHALCVEPQSGPPNQSNRAPHIVLPGEALVGSMTLAWRNG